MNNLQSCGSVWSETSFTVKLYSILSVITFLLVIVDYRIGLKLIDIPLIVYLQMELWRPLTSILVVGVSKLSGLNLLFEFMWLRNIIKVIR